MEENEHDKEVSKIIRQFFEKKFPLEEVIFKNKYELLNYYVDKEIELNDQLKELLDKLKPVPYNKMKIAHNTLLENLIISFELNGYSEDITKIIQNRYKKTVDEIVKDTKQIKNPERFVTFYISDKLNAYTNNFYTSLAEKFKREEFPNFLVSKFIQLIKNKYLTLLSEKNIDVSYFYLSDKLITLIDIYQDIFIHKKKFLFNAKDNNECTQEYFELILLSNNFNFQKKEMKYLDHLIQDFKYFAYIFNLNTLYENKEYDESYNINKLIQKYISEYIEITPEEAENKKAKILEKIIPNNSDNKESLLNIVLSYTLILNYLVTKNSKTGEIEVSMTDNYTSFASMKVLLENTLNNFELSLDAEEIEDFTESMLIKDLFCSQNYYENKKYDIEKIKDILTNNPKNKKLKKLAVEFFKGLFTEKHNKVLEFILSRDQSFKDNNVRQINLAPLNPRVTATNCYIFISGFLSETSDHYEEWENMALNLTSNSTCYFYNWPGDCLSNFAGETIFNLGLSVLSGFSRNSRNTNTNNVNTINTKNYGINKYDKFDPGKSFIDSSNKAALSGKILAFILASKLFLKYQTVTLISFSLGTHVTKHCIKQMYQFHYKEHIPCNDIIKDVVLIAGATSMKKKEAKFKNIFSKMINGKLINCYSKEDQVLNILYTGCMNKKPIGNSELELDGFENLKNIDFTPFHLGHTDYRNKMDLVMSKVDLYI
jgi:hypothetical protein